VQYAKAEAIIQHLRCEIIQKSTDLWPQPEKWRARESVFHLMKHRYDTPFCHCLILDGQTKKDVSILSGKRLILFAFKIKISLAGAAAVMAAVMYKTANGSHLKTHTFTLDKMKGQ
jgi:hypothetical protein